jgi:hypothetical protein
MGKLLRTYYKKMPGSLGGWTDGLLGLASNVLALSDAFLRLDWTFLQKFVCRIDQESACMIVPEQICLLCVSLSRLGLQPISTDR